MLEFLTSVIFQIAEYRVTTFIVSYVISGFIFIFAAKILSGRLKIFFRFIAVLIFIYGNLNIFFGHIIAGNLIYRTGEKGTAVTVGIRQTNNQYNNYWVNEHSIILETKDGEKYETTFEDSDFNIYPEPEQGYVYPAIGEKYSVKYLKSSPKAFVIISDDESPYARRLKCANLRKIHSEAYQKFKYDSLNSAYRENYIKAREELIKNGCGDK